MNPDLDNLPLPALTQFEAIRHLEEDGYEYWMARELMPVLG